jgi:hypothetical protein
VAITTDLMIGSRIHAAAERAGAELAILDTPSGLEPLDDADVVLVDWSARQPGWGTALRAWADRHRPDRPPARPRRLILFGRHTDLAAHAEARTQGLGPMWARSKLIAELPSIIAR